MRLVYAFVQIRKGEYEIEESYKGPLCPGRIKVGRLSRSASVHGLWMDILRACPDIHLYMAAESSVEVHECGVYADAEVERLSWVLLPLKCTTRIDFASTSGSDRAFVPFQDSNNNRVPIPLDIVTAEAPFIARHISLLLSHRSRLMPGCVRHESGYGPRGNIVEQWGAPGSNEFVRDAMVAAGLGIWHVFLSEDNMKNYSALFFRGVLSASMVRKMTERSAVFRNGVDLSLAGEISESMDDNRGRAIGSFYRLSENKGTYEVLALYQKMAMAGQIDRATITWAKGESLEDGLPADNKSIPDQFDFHPNCSRREYLEKASAVACAVFNSVNESSPICPVECAAVGCVPILPNRGWVKSMAPGLPLVYDSFDEVPGMITYAIEHQDELRPKAVEYATKHYDVNALGPAYTGHLKDIAAGQNRVERMVADGGFDEFCEGKYVSRLDEMVGDRKEVTWKEVISHVGIPRSRFGGPALLTHNDLPALMAHRYGFRDDLSGPLPIFRR